MPPTGEQREGDRQQQRQRRERPDARQHADQRADHAAEQAEMRFCGVRMTPKPVKKAAERVHGSEAPRAARQLQLEQIAEQPQHDGDGDDTEQDRRAASHECSTVRSRISMVRTPVTRNRGRG